MPDGCQLILPAALQNLDALVERIALDRLDDAEIALLCNPRVDRQFAEDGNMMSLGDLIDVGFAEYRDLFAAVRAGEIAHILDEAENRHIHQSSHLDRLFHDHRDQILRTGHNDDPVYRQGLKNGQRDISGSRRHIDEHIVHITPDNIRPELGHGPGNHRAAPDDGIGLVLEQQVDRHDLDTGAGLNRQDPQLIADRTGLEAEHLGNGRAGDIGVQHGDVMPAAAHLDRQHAAD